MTFIKSISTQYFAGNHFQEVLNILEPVNNDRPEVHAWIERMSKYMCRQDIGGRDFSLGTAWVVSTFVPKLLPGAWNGGIPPITLKGRHLKIDN